MDAEPEIPRARFAAFLRQHTHDVRNALDSLELETALLKEIAPEGEVQKGVERVRRQLRALREQVRSLSAMFHEPQPVAAPIAARELFLIWEEQQGKSEKPSEMKWVDELGAEQVVVDVGMMVKVFRELLTNAAAFSDGDPMTASARRESDAVVFELREPKSGAVDVAGWGGPFTMSRRRGYGMGLWSIGRLLQANHARIVQRYEPAERALISRIFVSVCE